MDCGEREISPCPEQIATQTGQLARQWSEILIRRESRGPGDDQNAMQRVARRIGIGWRVLQTLRYRRPDDVLASVFLRIHAAYVADIARQQQRLEHELSIASAVFSPDSLAPRAARLVAGPHLQTSGEPTAPADNAN